MGRMGRFIRPARTAFRAVITVAMSGGLIAGCGASDSHKSVEPVGEVAAAEGGTKVAAPVVTEDGRMLKPEGYEGIWFETEPTDPWERLVWLSQKHIGDPVLLGQLGPGDAAEAFVGQPDICSEDLVARMEAMGLENVKGINERKLRSCDFEFLADPHDIFPTLVSLNLPADFSTTLVEPVSESVEREYGGRIKKLKDTDGDLGCVAVSEIESAGASVLVATEADFLAWSFERVCRRTFLAFMAFNNLGIIRGNHDHV